MSIQGLFLLFAILFSNTEAGIPGIEIANNFHKENFEPNLYEKLERSFGKAYTKTKNLTHDLQVGVTAILEYLKATSSYDGLRAVAQSIKYDDRRRLEDMLVSFFHQASCLSENPKSVTEMDAINTVIGGFSFLHFPIYNNVYRVSRLLCAEFGVDYLQPATAETVDDCLKDVELDDLFLLAHGLIHLGPKVMKKASTTSEAFNASWEDVSKRSAQSIVEALNIVTSITEPADNSKSNAFKKAMENLDKLKEKVKYLDEMYPKSLFNDKKRFIILFGSTLALVTLLNVLGLILLGK
jgi:hypothetical protein